MASDAPKLLPDISELKPQIAQLGIQADGHASGESAA